MTDTTPPGATLTDALADEQLAAFPADFAWGAATSAYQIEGAVAEGGRGPSIWDSFAHTPGRTIGGEHGDVACDHYRRWESDVDVMGDVGLTAYRLSLSWSRLQPTGTGPLNPVGVAFYRSLIERLVERGIRPFVSLYHWDMPQVLEDAGGWPLRETAQRFADYAALVIAELGDIVTDWVTVNEPWCASFLGYGEGAHAPGRQNLDDAVAAGHHLNLAHGLAMAAMRAERTGLSIAATNLVTDPVAASDCDDDVAAATRVDVNNNRFFLDPMLAGGYSNAVHADYPQLASSIRDGDEALIGAPCDFVGVNHYQQVVVSAGDDSDGHLRARQAPAEPATTSLQWSVKPEAFVRVLQRVTALTGDLPVYVLENGASYEDELVDGRVDDRERIQYLAGYLGAAAEAIRKGVNLRGYFAWSLLDNFEWAEGYRKRFGLVYVDFATQQRVVKSSGHWYRETAARHAALTRGRPT